MRSGSEDNKRPSPLSSASVPDRQPAEPDSDDQSIDNDPDPDSGTQTAKRKRPISVSYVAVQVLACLAGCLSTTYADDFCAGVNCASSAR